jgi:hypothetical protein
MCSLKSDDANYINEFSIFPHWLGIPSSILKSIRLTTIKIARLSIDIVSTHQFF